MDNPVVIIDYDPAWPAQFALLRGAIASKLGDLALAIEHIGSTAVPELPAKAIIDIDLVIETRDQLPAVIEALAELGYVHQGDLGIPGREAFKRPDATAPFAPTRPAAGWPAHYLYVCDRHNPELMRHLAFRDYLRAHRNRAAAYADLKRELAERFAADRDGYSSAKAEFVEETLSAPSR